MTLTLHDLHQTIVTDLNLLIPSEWDAHVELFGGVQQAASNCDAFLQSLERHTVDCDGHRLPLLSKHQRERICDVTDRGRSLIVGDDRKYLIVRRLGDKSFQGEVYLARDCTGLKRVVAVKRISFAGLNSLARNRWERECRILCDLSLQSHPNRDSVVVGIEVISDNQTGSNLVMEFVPGRTLQEICDVSRTRCLRFSVRHALLFAESILRGLEFLHGAECVHRDLKPANLIHLDRGDDRYFIRIVDLGLVRVNDEAQPNPTRGGMGTFYYSAPECFAGGTAIDGRADLYSLAAVLSTMLCGEPPAHELCLSSSPSSKQLSDILKWLERRQPWKRTRLDSIRPDVPSALSDLIERCLEPDPDKRPRDVAEFRLAFDPILKELKNNRLVQRQLQVTRLTLIKDIKSVAQDADTHTPHRNVAEFQKTIRKLLNSKTLRFPNGCRLPASHQRGREYNEKLMNVADELNRLLAQVDSLLGPPVVPEAELRAKFDAALLEFQRLLPRFLALEHSLADCLGEAML